MENVNSRRYIISIFFVLICILTKANVQQIKQESKINVLDLKCEYATNPIGLDVLSPQLSWRLISKENATSQTAYQIIVADSPEKITQNIANMWDSGKIFSNKSTGVSYKGVELKSKQQYFWKVKIWDKNNKESNWSDIAFFEMGLLNQKDWISEWIGSGPLWENRVKYFRKTFTIDKEIKSARFYIAGIGYYELFINGSKIGDQVLDPGTTSYDKRVLYSTFDVKNHLKNQNVIGVTVAPGWYGTEKLRAQLEINFSDGTKNTLITSGSTGWSVSIGPIVSSSIFDGETYDARLERSGWNSEIRLNNDNLDRDYGWKNVVNVDPPGGKLVAQKLEPIKIVDVIVPKIIKEPKPGIYVIDTEQNMAGWASLKIKGTQGTKITLKFAESLYEDGTVNQENLRLAAAKDTYILNGNGEESWEPSFTYHGFRYIQVEGFPYKPIIGDIKVKFIRSAVNSVGKFKCSNELLNSIFKMVVSTEASNLHSIPTDCPQRDERMGWLNDLTVRIDQALYNFDLSRFYAKYIDDVKDTQRDDGSITCTAPFRWGNNPADPVSASYLLLAFQSYIFYDNINIINEHYEGLKSWVDYLYSRTENGIVNYSYYGDWSPPIKFAVNPGSANSKDTPGSLMSTGYLYYCSNIISQLARTIGNSEDESTYKQLSKEIADAFNREYWNEQTGGYASNNQASNSFALFLKIVPENRIQRVVNNLVEDVKKNDFHLTTGNLCTKYLLEMLTEYGHHEIAYKIATQKTYPSWGYMLDNGATTLWERWEYATGGAMNSHNHPMMGSIGSWFYKYVIGIQPNNNAPGFSEFTIHPYIFEDLDFAEGEFDSIKGKIKSSWKKGSGSIMLSVVIPENTNAIIYIPTTKLKSITANNKNINRIKEIKFLRSESQYAVYSVGSGSYNFKSAWL